VIEAEVAPRDAPLGIDQKRHHHVLDVAVCFPDNADAVTAQHAFNLVGISREKGPLREVRAARQRVAPHLVWRIALRVEAYRHQVQPLANIVGQALLQLHARAGGHRARSIALRVHKIEQYSRTAQRVQRPLLAVLVNQRKGWRLVFFGNDRVESRTLGEIIHTLLALDFCERHDAKLFTIGQQIEADAVSHANVGQ
jgi:hypothetical protein